MIPHSIARMFSTRACRNRTCCFGTAERRPWNLQAAPRQYTTSRLEYGPNRVRVWLDLSTCALSFAACAAGRFPSLARGWWLYGVGASLVMLSPAARCLGQSRWRLFCGPVLPGSLLSGEMLASWSLVVRVSPWAPRWSVRQALSHRMPRCSSALAPPVSSEANLEVGVKVADRIWPGSAVEVGTSVSDSSGEAPVP